MRWIARSGHWRTAGGLFDCLLEAGALDVFTNALSGTDVVAIESNIEITNGVLDLDGQIVFNSPVPNEFKVVGDAATIEFERLNQLDTSGRTNTTFTFVFDGDGVSPINMSGYMNLSGAKIAVDGSAYTGIGA